MNVESTSACAVTVTLVTLASRRVQATWYMRLAAPERTTAA